MKFAVLGSNSFSGSNLIDKLLTNGDTVLGISRSNEKPALYLPYKTNLALKNFRFVSVDINATGNILREIDDFEPDYIINYAALNEVFPSLEHFDDYYQTNMLSTAKLVNGLRDKKYLKRYLHISTCEVYGDCEGLATEDAPLKPTTPYAISKAAIDLHLLSMFRHYGFPVTITRSTSVYGAHQQLFKLIPKTILTFLDNKPMTIHGDGKVIRTWVSIDDISNGVATAIKYGKAGEIYNLSSENRYNILLTVMEIARIMKVEGLVEYVKHERHGQDNAYRLDYLKARKELFWSPRVNFEQGIKETVKWIESNYTAIQNENKMYIHKA